MPTVELITTHTHRGAVYRPGALLAVADFTARWLLTRGIARLPVDPLPLLDALAHEPQPDAKAEPAPASPPRKRRPASEPTEIQQ